MTTAVDTTHVRYLLEAQMTESTTDFGRRLVEAMTEEKMTQGELERRVGFTSRGAVTRLKGRGKRPSFDIVQRLAAALRVRPEWLGNGEGPMRSGYEELGNMGKAIATAAESSHEPTDQLAELPALT